MNHATVIKRTGARQGQRRLRRGDREQRSGDLLRLGTLNLTDEAQGQVQLVFRLPADCRHVRHGPRQHGSLTGGEAQGDKQAVHDPQLLSRPLYFNMSPRAKDRSAPSHAATAA
ncbi:hypothetical protein [uncultured Sphingomonas sp.]|uniref:hypothetical protein n=1 Tax=uncultured Sphingomonas sp. TaxID=158754 RepID=UPI0025E01A97|nr:hypothetical protein [uncultured Sphingomonas sp.]